MQSDGRQDLTQPDAAGETQHAGYEAPRVIQLGKSKDLIRGNANISNWDSQQGSKQWYQSGE